MKMAEFTTADLTHALRAAAGEDGGSLGLDGEEVLDRTFADLGYDSLAVMETASLVEREFGVSLPEDDLASIETLREFIGFVNGRLSTAV